MSDMPRFRRRDATEEQVLRELLAESEVLGQQLRAIANQLSRFTDELTDTDGGGPRDVAS